MRVIFMGTPDFSVSVLDALVSAGHKVVCVYTQPPRPAGRGKKLRPSPVQSRAESLGLTVRYPLNFKDKSNQETFSDLNADVAIVVAYGLILPQVILDAPTRGCINIHASLLPRWRGAAPIQRAIMAGDPETGVCIMQMAAGLDTGPVLTRATTPISKDDTSAILHNRLANMGAELMVNALENLNSLTPVSQPANGVTYAAKIDKSEAKIDWQKPAIEIDRLIRGISPFPGAWFSLNGVRIKALLSRTINAQGPAGTTLDSDLTIACKTGAVRLLRVQKSGKAPQDADDFLRGNEVPRGTTLE
ncbi:MAG: methionyl-tRNA formyltransferase [Paracoccaceae bacterium]